MVQGVKVVVLVGPDAVVDDVTLVLFGRWSVVSLVFGLIQEMRNVVWNEAMGFFVDNAESGFHTSYVEGLPFKLG